VSAKAEKRLSTGDKRLKEKIVHYAWRREELLWLKRQPDLPHELLTLIDARLHGLAAR
jgi:hypothetical protein